MTNYSQELITLARYLAGEFENKAQAAAEPIWYVPLRLWKRPIPLFSEDSIALYAEQVSMVNPDKPYRPRLLRLRPSTRKADGLEVQYYMFEDIDRVLGAGEKPEILTGITPEDVKLLPDCHLEVEANKLDDNRYHFRAFPVADKLCSFTYGGNNFQVSLGFEVNAEELLVYDKGIDRETGKAIWGALMGAFRFRKNEDFSGLLPNIT
jgi:CpeT/CpcT family (DUF1001)